MKKLFAFVALLLIPVIASAGILTLLSGATTTGAGTSVNIGGTTPYRWYQATLNGASAVSATVTVEGSADNTNWSTISTLDLTVANPVSAVATIQAAPYIRGNVTAISGVGESVTLKSAQ